MKNSTKNIYRAAGAIFLSVSTGRILLALRSSISTHPRTWGFFGGMVRPHEKIYEGLTREIEEEIGFVPYIEKMFPFNIYESEDKGFNYYSTLIIVEEEFIPKLNKENDGYAWIKIGAWPRPLHPATSPFLNNKDIKSKLNLAWNKNQSTCS